MKKDLKTGITEKGNPGYLGYKLKKCNQYEMV